MWTSEIVRARFVEAADTESRLPRGNGPTRSGFWPAYNHTFEDMSGWGSERLAEEREMRSRRMPPSSAAISRHEEAMQWTASFVRDERHRHLIWAWARCRLSGASFSSRCRRHGVSRATAYRWLDCSIGRISAKLSNNAVLLRYPDEIWLRQEGAISGTSADTIGSGAQPPISSTPAIFDGDRPGHTVTSPQAIEGFEAHVDHTNHQRQAERERRRRKLLGIGDALT